MFINTIEQENFKNKKVIIRVDYNVPIDNKFNILDQSRILISKNTIYKVLSDGGCILLISHLGSPNGKYSKNLSFSNIINQIKDILKIKILLIPNKLEYILNINYLFKKNKVIMIDNIRFDIREQKKDLHFANILSKNIDCYINEAFSASHRDHTSLSLLPLVIKKKLIGYSFYKEISTIDNYLINTDKFNTIIGGLKISTKINLIKSLIKKNNKIIIGGAMAYTFIKALGGYIGDSFYEKDCINVCKEIINEATDNKVEIILPKDVICYNKYDKKIKKFYIYNIPDGFEGMDIGNDTIELFKNKLYESETIFWNGPLGLFENNYFSKGSIEMAKFLINLRKINNTVSILGGGDTMFFLKKYNINKDKFSFISTGGGALLKYIEINYLPILNIFK